MHINIILLHEVGNPDTPQFVLHRADTQCGATGMGLQAGTWRDEDWLNGTMKEPFGVKSDIPRIENIHIWKQPHD